MMDSGDDRRSNSTPGREVESLARAVLDRVADRSRSNGPSDYFIDRLCIVLVSGDYAASEALLRSRIAWRADYAELADEVLSAAARALGRKWESDTLSFAEVTVAISQILRLNQTFSRRHVPISRSDAERVALFATIEGQGHSLGIVLAAEAFRQRDWHIEMILEQRERTILDRVVRLRPEVLGLTVSGSDRMTRIGFLVREVNRLPVPVTILLGGQGAAKLAAALPAERKVRVVTDIVSALRDL
jgi:methanogenic corrinoid protein MtbC1